MKNMVLPGVLLMDSGSAPTGTGAPRGNRVDAAQFFGCQAVTPETEKTSHYFLQQSHGFALDDPSVTDVLINGAGLVWVERHGTLMPTTVAMTAAEVSPGAPKPWRRTTSGPSPLPSRFSPPASSSCDDVEVF